MTPMVASKSACWGTCRVVYCVVMKANPGIMSCHHNTYPSQQYANCCCYHDGLEIYRVYGVITLPEFGHIEWKTSTCDDMSANSS